MRQRQGSLHKRRVALARAFARQLKSDLGTEVRQVVLFGSVARGDDNQGSDIDLLVEVRRRTPALEDRVFGAVMDVVTEEGELIVPMILSSREHARHLPDYLEQRLRSEGRVLA